ncbi:MAG: hypothetical protein A2Y82_02900 [Candidatus Buchananbacteria bacterium RBG_13_36_9]|uniref:Uncharacterized protein n=1 Tax=Candidatus Buchananbacteria bacterium RBG_13_36_9 TaxID=1797530 RepID=A0A1G1XSL0_9BACT|nr:MAG: hypothetical protein A2Y82_02900 [Candidatus Buchananbacteria bacterium RBG_13_36_9]
MKKCKKCGAPLEGFLYKTIGKLMGIKPSEQDPETCNKCAETKTEEKAEVKAEEPVVPAAETKPELSSEEKVEENKL